MYIQTLPAAPGDVIVVTVPQSLTQAERDALEARVAGLVADTRVLVLDGGMQMSVLHKPVPDAACVTRDVVGEKEPVVVRDVRAQLEAREAGPALPIPHEAAGLLDLFRRAGAQLEARRR